MYWNLKKSILRSVFLWKKALAAFLCKSLINVKDPLLLWNEEEDGWSWAPLMKCFFLQLFPNPQWSLHPLHITSLWSVGLRQISPVPGGQKPFIREGRLHAACNTKRGCYCGENWYHQLNHHFPSFLFHKVTNLSPRSPPGGGECLASLISCWQN